MYIFCLFICMYVCILYANIYVPILTVMMISYKIRQENI